MKDRPFKVLGIQQIAVSGLDKTRLRSLWVDTFGLELTGTYKSERENVDEDIAVLGAGPLPLPILEAQSPDEVKVAVNQLLNDREDYDPEKIPVLFVYGVSGFAQNWRVLFDRMDRERFQPWLPFASMKVSTSPTEIVRNESRGGCRLSKNQAKCSQRVETVIGDNPRSSQRWRAKASTCAVKGRSASGAGTRQPRLRTHSITT